MNSLIILGKAPINKTIKELQQATDSDIWLCGTDARKGGDLYFELHGIKVSHENTLYIVPDCVYDLPLPLNNTICVMLAYAYLEGYTDITILGAPMTARAEYLAQRPALAYCVGWLNAKGLEVKWSDTPSSINYGKRCR